MVVTSLGSIRNIEWLDGAGLAAGPWGVGCDAGCRAFDVKGVVTNYIFVAGDIARAPHVLYDYEFLAMEHWDNAVLGAQVAAHNMVCDEADRWAHLMIPQFWSPVEVICHILGVPIEDEPLLHAWVADAMAGIFDLGPEIETEEGQARRANGIEAGQALKKYIIGLVERAERSPCPGMISQLVHDDGPDGPMSPS